MLMKILIKRMFFFYTSRVLLCYIPLVLINTLIEILFSIFILFKVLVSYLVVCLKCIIYNLS